MIRKAVPIARPPLSFCKATGARLEKGSRVLVISDRAGAGEKLASQLRARGLEVFRVDDRAEPSVFEGLVADWARPGGVAGAFFLTALDPDPAEPIDLTRWRTLHRERVKLCRSCARALYDVLAEKGTFFVAATRLGGLGGFDERGATNPSGGAVNGFVKALARERSAATVKVVDFAPSESGDELARKILEETERDPGVVEVGYRDGARFSIGLVDGAVASRPVPLDGGTVFMVTGGAGDITSAIVLELARAARGGTFHLLDMLPSPSDTARRDAARLATDSEGLKREIFERLKASGERATPALVEAEIGRLTRTAKVVETMRAVEERGGKAHYHSVDVCDEAAVRSVVRAAREQSGRIDVLIHAAGLERSRTLDRKPNEEFDLVFGVKSDGIHNLLAATSEDSVRALVCFSSVAGRFGNAGQTDYSSGNDLMAKVASNWGAAHPESLAVVLDWTAWAGSGMATRGSIPEMMKRAGIEMIDMAGGTAVVRDALVSGLAGEMVVSRSLGILLQSADEDGGVEPGAIAAAGPRGKRPAFQLGKASFEILHGLVVEAHADPGAEPFLKDHAIDGVPVLPGVMGLEAFAEVASLICPTSRVEAIEDVQFLAPFKYHRHAPRPAIVRARALASEGGRIRVESTLSSIQTLVGREPTEKLHFTATVVLAPESAPPSPPIVEPRAPDGNRPGSIDRDAIYQVYFHGPAYRVLSGVERSQDGGALGKLERNLPADTSSPDATCLFAPRLVELAFQTAGVWEIGESGQLGLPAAIDRVKVWDPTPNGKPLVAEARPRQDPRGACFDVLVRDPDGRVHVELEGYRTSRLPSKLPEAQLAPFREVVR